MNIVHHPYLNTEHVIARYSEKEGVPIRYVCTSATNQFADFAVDVFYRPTPHPDFGNHYFGLFNRYTQDGQSQVMICNADSIEQLTFNMLEVDGSYHYSQHRHDYYQVKDAAIDGGRAYLRLGGNMSYPVISFTVKDGDFVIQD